MRRQRGGGLVGLLLQRPRPVMPVPPPVEAQSGWVAATYGWKADALVKALPGELAAAGAEAGEPSAPGSTGAAQPSSTHRGLLWEHLRALRTQLLEVEVPVADVPRDRRLRAAVANAIGAASSLAAVSGSQPTSGYLGLTRTGVDEVLEAAEQRPSPAHRALW